MSKRSPLDTPPGRYWVWRRSGSQPDAATQGAARNESQIRLAILTTHPIQYHAPWFRALAQESCIDLQVYYCHQADMHEQGSGFGVPFSWDVPLLSGYRYWFLRNMAATPSLAGFNGLNTPEIARIIEAGGADVVLVNGWHYRSAWQAIQACWRARIPVIVRGDSHLRSPRSLFRRLIKELPFRLFIPRLAGCAAAGKWSRDYFLHYGADPNSIFTIPHVVDVDRLQNQAEHWRAQRAVLRRRWGLRTEGMTFIFVGKFVEKKRPLAFIRAVARARTEGADVQGLMVGDGTLRQQCEAETKALNAPVTFTGFLNQSEIAAAYCAADALVLPSDGGETWGLVVNEAMACGLPCIVSDHVGCGPDLVAHRGTGEVFPLDDVPRLAALMAEWATAPGRLQEMGRQARLLSATFAPEAAACATTAACQALVDAKRKNRVKRRIAY